MDVHVHLSFYVFDNMEFDLLIGQPIERLFVEGETGNLDVRLGKGFRLPLSINHSIYSKIEPDPEPVPMEEVKEASLEHFVNPIKKMLLSFSSKKKKKILPNLNPLMNLRNLLDLPLSLNLYHLVLDMLFSTMI